jgi:cytoskeletal protein RodZ
MPDFKGSELKKIREERNIPLEQIASETRIRLSILQDLEDDAYSELSSSAQARGFLRLYAHYLGLDKAEPELPAATLPAFLPESGQQVSTPNPQPATISSPALAPKVEIREKTVIPPQPKEEPAETDSGGTESKNILEKIGRELSARRRYLNIGWDVIHEQIHIPKVQIQALERGDLKSMTNPMQYKGLLQTYARFLNLDVESIMIRYADALQKRRVETNATKRRQRKPGKVLPPILVNLKRLFTLDLFFGTLLILGILGFLIWGIARMSEATQAPRPPAPCQPWLRCSSLNRLSPLRPPLNQPPSRER